MISTTTYKLLLASKLRGIGRRGLQELAADKLFFRSRVHELGPAVAGIANPAPSAAMLGAAERAANADVEAAEKRGHFIVSLQDQNYPKLLRKLHDRPAILFMSGDPERLSERSVAIIGTREPSTQGEETARRVTQYFAANGWQIVSGLAVGLDTVAHRTALESGGTTVAVLAQGLDKIYPKENAELAEQIVQHGGVLVSEYSYGSQTFPSNFVERDRIQAGLARGVVMVQSDEAGGSWHASRAALRYGRYLIIPSPTDADIKAGHPKVRGNLRILHSSPEDRAAFLKCSVEELKRLRVLESRDDYPSLESTLRESAA